MAKTAPGMDGTAQSRLQALQLFSEASPSSSVIHGEGLRLPARPLFSNTAALLLHLVSNPFKRGS